MPNKDLTAEEIRDMFKVLPINIGPININDLQEIFAQNEL